MHYLRTRVLVLHSSLSEMITDWLQNSAALSYDYQVSWLPCEALAIATGVQHFAPYLRESKHLLVIFYMDNDDDNNNNNKFIFS